MFKNSTDLLDFAHRELQSALEQEKNKVVIMFGKSGTDTTHLENNNIKNRRSKKNDGFFCVN